MQLLGGSERTTAVGSGRRDPAEPVPAQAAEADLRSVNALSDVRDL